MKHILLFKKEKNKTIVNFLIFFLTKITMDVMYKRHAEICNKFCATTFLNKIRSTIV